MKTKILFAALLMAGVSSAAFAEDYNKTSYERRSSSTTTTTRTYPAERQWMGLEGPYITAFGGWNNTEDNSAPDTDGGWLGGVAVGGKTKWARAELEVSYRNNDIDGAAGGDVDSVAGMANAYYDLENDTRFTPYIGAGIGIAHVDFDTAGGDESTEFAYQGIAGVNYAIDARWHVGAEYRYFATTEVDSTDYDNHAVVGNVRYQF